MQVKLRRSGDNYKLVVVNQSRDIHFNLNDKGCWLSSNGVSNTLLFELIARFEVFTKRYNSRSGAMEVLKRLATKSKTLETLLSKLPVKESV